MDTQLECVEETPEQYMQTIRPIYALYLNATEGYGPRGYDFNDDDFKILYVTDEYHEVEIEYNDACSCHPEYVTREYSIPVEWIRKYYNGPANTTFELTRMREERIQADKKAKEEKERKEKEKQAQQQRERELEQLRKLKEKYEGVIS